MGLKDVQSIRLHVFEIADSAELVPIGEVEEFTSLQWTKRYWEYGEFSLNANYTETNVDLLKIGNILWLSGEPEAMMITIIKYTIDEEGQKEIECEGRSLEFLISYRIIWGRETYKNQYVSTILYTMFNNAFINPSIASRTIPIFENGTDAFLGGKTSIQKTGQSLYETMSELAQSVGLGYRIRVDYKKQKLVFEVYEGVDRTLTSENVEERVVFSDMADEFLTSEYYLNNQDEKNICLIYGEGEYPNRKQLVFGDETKSGLFRKELWVDAKDLQSKNDDGETTMTDEEYYALLQNRGTEKLAENCENETFEVKMRMFGDKLYELDTDYSLGDKVTIYSRTFNVKVDARIMEVTYNISSNLDIELTFGYGYPTIARSVKKMISDNIV